jgi:hypothetical protein
MTGPIESALREAAAHEHRQLPGELAHLMLFYSVGKVVREYFPDHIPYADTFGLWQQNRRAERYHSLLQQEWQPYLSGRRGFSDAILHVVRGLPSEAM